MLHVFWQSAVLFILYKTDHLWPNQYKNFIKKEKQIVAQENKLPFMHRLMYSIYSNQNVPFKFQVDERKYCAHKHIKKAHSTTYNTFQNP